MIGATVLMAIVVPPLFVFMPDLIRIVFYPGQNGAPSGRVAAQRGSS